MKRDDIVLDDEINELLPPLASHDLKILEDSIKEDGIQAPLIIDSNNRLIDGYHRLKIAEQLNLNNLPVEKKDISNEKAIILGISLNLARRHLTIEQKKVMIDKLRAKGFTQEAVAKAVGVSRRSVGQTEHTESNTSNGKIANTCIPDLRYKINKEDEQTIFNRSEGGESQEQIAADYGISQQRVAQIIAKCKARQRKPKELGRIVEPTNTYKAIIIDPPWPVKKIERDVRPKQGISLNYPTMTIDQIKDLPIQDWADPNGCHIYLWSTHKYLPIAFEIFEVWNVKYECLLTWVKNVGFTPYSWMYSTEQILFGRIGSLSLLKNGIRLDFNAKVREHSRKPDEFYNIVRAVSPEPRLDVFSREKRQGFEQHGDELDKFKKA